MSTIGGIGSYGGISLSGFRNKPSEEQGELALMARNVEKTTRTASAESEREFRARQATEEGFARLRVALQTTAEGQVETGVSSGTVEKPLAEDSGDAALAEFMAYMAMTPAEKIRYGILKEMGLTEEDIEAMSPEQQQAVEQEIAQRIKDRAEMQAQEEGRGRSYGLI
ncbi:hypothetical protein EQ836_05425 [Ectopseudomonas mendocina]|uniref:Uncharacterized protein n=1 Tax=Ectopseudomonas mendocina TaxID=300 RepID=A0ABD7S2R4_ECTME|nr:hypothetical protein [Pseudomonas mendocina]TRO16074.1 hypothetical protein EQ829_04585 [Pseudomonas mendocina]TRO20327.1 hypothetical protein EQ836_05425 [Pseudomonas mendocina]